MNRRLIQYTSALLSNANLTGFVSGRIYQGASKHICVPGLNCYSCPGAIGACPLGALQTILASGKYMFSCYVTGILLLFGVLMGRLICGWLCPFGLIQELLHKLPSPAWTIPRWARYIKYMILVVFIFLMPMLLVNNLGMGEPSFCKYICPAGTLEGGIPLLVSHPDLRNAAGNLFLIKFLILVLAVILSIISFRPFCKIICPLGAIYGLFNPISMYRYKVDSEKCIGCGTCVQNCKMGVAMYKEPDSPECIRCGDCRQGCPVGAITASFQIHDRSIKNKL